MAGGGAHPVGELFVDQLISPWRETTRWWNWFSLLDWCTCRML